MRELTLDGMIRFHDYKSAQKKIRASKMRSLSFSDGYKGAICCNNEPHPDIPRQGARCCIRANAVVFGSDGKRFPAELIDISAHGCAVFGPGHIRMGEYIVVAIRELAGLEGKVRWARKRTLGIEFLRALDPATLATIRNSLTAD